jgi:hypothetical protein
VVRLGLQESGPPWASAAEACPFSVQRNSGYRAAKGPVPFSGTGHKRQRLSPTAETLGVGRRGLGPFSGIVPFSGNAATAFADPVHAGPSVLQPQIARPFLHRNEYSLDMIIQPNA